MSAPASQRNLLRWLGPLLLLGTSLAVALGLAEIALRVGGFSNPLLFEEDALTGAWHRPGAEGVYRDEGESLVRINAEGMRDRDHARQKPAGVFRIAVLGDSYTEALQVPLESNFVSVLEHGLAACPALGGLRPEALNFGVSGFGTAQALLTLRHRALAYQPDLVVLAFVSNDLRNNSKALERDPARPYFRLEGGELVLDDSFLAGEPHKQSRYWLRRAWRRLNDHSRAAQLVNAARAGLRRRELARTEVRELVYAAPREPVWEETWQVTEALVAAVARESVAAGARFLLAVITTPTQVDPDRERRSQLLEENGGDDLGYFNQRLVALAGREGFPALSLAEPLLRHAEASGRCLHGFENAIPCRGHWNEEGHRLAGELIAREACERLAGSARQAPADASGQAPRAAAEVVDER